MILILACAQKALLLHQRQVIKHGPCEITFFCNRTVAAEDLDPLVRQGRQRAGADVDMSGVSPGNHETTPQSARSDSIMLVRETGLAHRRQKHKHLDDQDEKDDRDTAAGPAEDEAEGRDAWETANWAQDAQHEQHGQGEDSRGGDRRGQDEGEDRTYRKEFAVEEEAAPPAKRLKIASAAVEQRLSNLMQAKANVPEPAARPSLGRSPWDTTSDRDACGVPYCFQRSYD